MTFAACLAASLAFGVSASRRLGVSARDRFLPRRLATAKARCCWSPATAPAELLAFLHALDW